ncbi:unnamed protein product [Heterobilharzia americana]|nr:unnamed protein product [Heterobilharzia americana]
MSSDFRSAMIQVIAQLCGQVGFEQITEASLELLINVVEAYFFALVKNVHILTTSDGCAQVADGLLALRLMGQTPQGLAKFVVENSQFFTPAPSMTCGPVYGKLCLDIPPENHPELEERPLFIPRHLPLNYREDFESQNFSQAEQNAIESRSNGFSTLSFPCTVFTNTHCLSGSTTSAITSIARTLPEWASRSTYRMTCISVDPVTKSLVEHCPPWKASDMLSESPVPDNYASCSSNNFFSSISRRELGYDSTPDDVKNIDELAPKQSGASDEQWAAALQATPSSQQSKRIVYTPSRFDPSSIPPSSNIKRIYSSSRASLLSKHNTGENSRNKRQASSLPYSTASKVSRLSSGCRVHRRSKVGRGQSGRLSKHRVSKPSTSNSPVTEGPCEDKSMTRKSPTPVSEFNVDIINTELSPLDSDTSTLSNGIGSPKSGCEKSFDFPAKLINDQPTPPRIESGDEKQTIWNGKDYPEHESPCTPPLRNPVNNNSLMTSPVTDAPIDVIISPKQLDDFKAPIESELFDLKTTTIPDIKISPEILSSIKPKPPHHFRRKARGRRRDKCRVSAFNTLFQNPLRQKSSKPLPIKADDRSQDVLHTLLTKSENNFDDQQPVASTPVSRPDNSRQTRSLHKSVKKCLELKADESYDIIKSEPVTISLPFDNKSEIVDSPASDATEPMVYGDKAELLRIQCTDTSSAKCISSSSNLTMVSGSHFLKSDISVFNKESFGKLQQHASVALRSLPSSPSSLDSSLCSSSSSTPKSSLEQPLPMRLEVNDTKHPDHLRGDVSHCSQDFNKSLLPNSCVQTTVETNLSPAISPNPIQPSPVVSCVNKIYPVLCSPVYPVGVGPPPLLRLSNKLTEQKRSSSYHATPAESERISVLPPTLVPSCTVDPDQPKSQQSDSMTASSSCFFTNSQPLTSKPTGDKNGGLRITIKLGGDVLTEEHLASSLSPTSSSSSLSSSSGSTSGDDDNTPHYTQPLNPTHTFKKETESNTKGVVGKDRSDLYSGGLSQSMTSCEKTPKLVIRLGNGPISSGQPQTVTSSHVQSISQNLATHSENSASLVDKKYATSVTAAPPPLQLTISRDRLKYRGRTLSQGSDSNASNTSSTITRSLSSSEEEEDLTIQSHISPTATATLPPPPSLERLPPRPGRSGLSPSKLVGHGRSLHHSQLPPPLTPSTTVSDSLPPIKSKVSLTSTATNGPNSTTTHCHLPPLLPLFSSVPERDESVSSLSNSSVVIIDQPVQNKNSKSNSRFDRSKKRSRSNQDSHFPLAKRRAMNQPSVTHTLDRIKTTPIVQRPRATVDSVFTDDESDNKDDQSPLMSPPVSCSIDTTGSQGAIRTSTNRTMYIANSATNSLAHLSNSIPPPPKSQPRTKHTSLYNNKSLYRPVTKSCRTSVMKSSTSLKSGKGRGRSKPIPTSTMETLPAIASKIVQRETASQIVVESAGSSYYFNNDGEQIWLCPICLLEDDGNLMIGCDNCEDWYHR